MFVFFSPTQLIGYVLRDFVKADLACAPLLLKFEEVEPIRALHDPADAASETFEHAKDYALDENFHDMLERIAGALRKIDDGTYGVCDRCENAINSDRLKAIPYATLCIDCQGKLERQ